MNYMPPVILNRTIAPQLKSFNCNRLAMLDYLAQRMFSTIQIAINIQYNKGNSEMHNDI